MSLDGYCEKQEIGGTDGKDNRASMLVEHSAKARASVDNLFVRVRSSIDELVGEQPMSHSSSEEVNEKKAINGYYGSIEENLHQIESLVTRIHKQLDRV